jgi:hypothetical protein
VIGRDSAEETLSEISHKEIVLPPGAVVHGGPETCPACGSKNLTWGCDPELTRDRDEIHPLVWHETAWMADTFICQDCHAGWIEPNDPAVITWVRPYWKVEDSPE